MRIWIGLASAAAMAAPAMAQDDRTEITVARFFGACEAEYGGVEDASEANGECGIITALINEFNAESDEHAVREEIVEWPGYDQLTARLRIGDAPTISVMHQSILSDYVSRDLLIPLGEGLEEAGVDLSDMTEAARAGVTKDGEVYALPFDTLGWLWHVNLNLFEEAGLLAEDGSPMIPSSPDELLDHARQFKERTGKPYFVQTMLGRMQENARNLTTLVYQQDGSIFDDPKTLNLDAPEVHAYLDLFRTLYEEELTTTGMDYSTATSAFPNGAGGVYIMGTWLVDTFQQESLKPESALHEGYHVQAFPQLFAQDGLWSDGHAWVIPRQDLSDAEREAAFAFLAFLWENNFEWARTGHLPVRRSVLESDEYQNLPARGELSRVAEFGRPLPPEVMRQFSVTDIIGEEMGAAVAGQKSPKDAIASAEKRVNDMLARAR
jgi:multiple sugar transport system substrate-binding protein